MQDLAPYLTELETPTLRNANFMQSPFTRVTACHVTTYYYVGFCYLMLRRYPDAIRAFVTILNFIVRMRGYHTWSHQYDQVCCAIEGSWDQSDLTHDAIVDQQNC